MITAFFVLGSARDSRAGLGGCRDELFIHRRRLRYLAS